MKRCPTFHCCGILDFNVFSYELANFKMAQLCSNMKRCYPIIVTGIFIINTFDYKFTNTELTSFSSNMKWCFPSFVSSILFFQIFHVKVQTWKCPLPAARRSGVKLSFLLVNLTTICIISNCPFELQYEVETIVFFLL